LARVRRPPGGWPAAVAGAVFVAAGVALLAAAALRLLEAPPPLLAAFAAVFLAGGLLVAVQGFRGGERVRQEALHPQEPWRFDHPWDPGGALDETGSRARVALWQAIVCAAFLLPFNALSVLRSDAFPAEILVVADVVPPLLLGRALWLGLRRRKYGTSRLRFHRFPYLLGSPFLATLELGQRAPLVRALEVTLRCEERRPPGTGPEADPSAAFVDVELYRATQVTRGARRMELRFELPSDPRRGTELSSATPRRWWLRVRGRAPGVGYDATFLVPIYAPPEDGGPSAEG